MQPFNRRLTTAFLAFAIGIFHPCLLHAQDEQLDKPVRIKVTNKRLDKVLEQLSREENINFSYNSAILRKDRLVTVTIRESTLRQALALILGNEYAFGEMDNYVIVRKKGLTKQPFQKYGWSGKEPISKKDNKELLFKKDGNGPLFKKDSKGPIFKKDGEYDPISKKERFGDKPFKVEVLPKTFKVTMHPPTKIGIRPANSPELEESKQVMRNIIDDLVKEKIVTDKDHLEWFGLDNSQFVVNAKAVPDSLHAIFKARYLKPDGVGYYYGPVKVAGRGVFFEKKDLLPE
jgi:hypothetical protein